MVFVMLFSQMIIRRSFPCSYACLPACLSVCSHFFPMDAETISLKDAGLETLVLDEADLVWPKCTSNHSKQSLVVGACHTRIDLHPCLRPHSASPSTFILAFTLTPLHPPPPSCKSSPPLTSPLSFSLSPHTPLPSHSYVHPCARHLAH